MMKRLAILLIIAMVAVFAAGCGDDSVNISRPEELESVEGTEYTENTIAAAEDSFNVNGKRFTMTLYDFTSRFNVECNRRGDKEQLTMAGWKKNGQVTKDSNGVNIQYYYYDDKDLNLTATVEAETEKIVNIGCGTTSARFTAKEDGKNKSDEILMKSAIMAQVVCGYDSDSQNTMQTIFYKTATGSDKSLYYDGFVFSFSSKEDSTDKSNKLMLFRVFPVSDELQTEWKLPEY